MKQAIRTLSLTVALVMLAAFLPLSGNVAFTAHAGGSGDFIIEGGWLTGYTGDGGDIVIPDAVQYIDTEAFSGCGALTGVVIPASVRQIGDYAFYGCTGLKTVTVSGKVNYFGTDAFGSCPNLTAFLTSDGNNFYVSENGVLYNADQTTLILCPNGKKGAFTVPSTVRACSESLRARLACIFCAIFRQNPRQYTKYCLRFWLHLAQNLTARYAHAEILNRLLRISTGTLFPAARI